MYARVVCGVYIYSFGGVYVHVCVLHVVLCACACVCSVWARICVRLVMYDHQHNISIH